MEAANSNEDNKTIYVGNLSLDTEETFLRTLFSQFGNVISCRILNDGTVCKFAFIEYDDHKAAAMAIETMTGRVVLEQKIKVNWANSFQAASKNELEAGGYDKSNLYPIFVGDISDKITEDYLKEAFSKFGTIAECRIIRNHETNKSKNFGFITFVKKEDAENAMGSMNGKWMEDRCIRTNWAYKRCVPYMQTSVAPNVQPKNDRAAYEEINNLTGPTNSTIFCGNISYNLSEGLLRYLFSGFGPIEKIRVFPTKGYGFVIFARKSSAVYAIMHMNSFKFNGDVIKVSWGKEQSTAPMEYGGGNGYGSSVPGVEGYPLQYNQSGQENLWQMNYQNAYALFLQQQQFYNQHAVAPAPSASAYPFYPQGSSVQAPSTAVAGVSGEQFHPRKRSSFKPSNRKS